MSGYPPERRRQLLDILLREGRKKAAYAPLASEANVSIRTVYGWMKAFVRELAEQELTRLEAAPSPDLAAALIGDDDQGRSHEHGSTHRATFEHYAAHVRADQLESDLEESLRNGETEKALALFEELRALDPGRASMFEMRLQMKSLTASRT